MNQFAGWVKISSDGGMLGRPLSAQYISFKSSSRNSTPLTLAIRP